MSVSTIAGRAAGTLDQWTGAVTNVNEITVSDANFDTTTTSGAVQRYLMGTMGSSSYVVLAKVTNLRATLGSGSLAHLTLEELLSGASYETGPVQFPTAFGKAQFIQPVNPHTGVAWTIADINDTSRETGYKATT